MARLSLTLLMKDYDYLAPLACGDVVARDVDLTLVRDTDGALQRTLQDRSIEAGELSLGRHLVRLAEGDDSFVGVPLFAYRAFRHRCFFVRRGSGLSDVQQLASTRVGTNEWPATGNVWSRAVLRDAGVRLDGIHWLVGPIDRGTPDRAQGVLPPYVQPVPPGRALGDMLLQGGLDALMCPLPPRGFGEPDGPIVRLVPDYRAAEQAYYRRVRYYPAHHIVGVRREVFERHPWVAHRLYQAVEESRLLWQQRRTRWAESTPWFQAELDEVAALMGPDWQPNGSAPNLPMLQAICDELLAQGLISRPLVAGDVFTAFEQAVQGL